MVKKVLLILSLCFLFPFSAATPAHANANLEPKTLFKSDASVVTVCEGNELSLLNRDGIRLPIESIAINISVISSRCGKAPLSNPQLRIAGYLAARLNYVASTGLLFISADASSLVRGNYTISCIYRVEPVSGRSGPWQDCTAISGYNTTYLSTATIVFCPVPGTRWHAIATLSRPTSTNVLLTDDAWETAY